MSRGARARTDVRHWPGMRSEYSWIPPGEGATRTRPLQVGVAFSGHRAAVFETGGRTVQADIAPGSVFVTAGEPIVWTRITDPTEALEIYPDPDLLGPGVRELEPALLARDGTVLAIAGALARVHRTGARLDDLAADALAWRLAGHLRRRYGHGAAGDPPGVLGAREVDRVAEFVEAGLDRPVTVAALAAVAHLSPYHFARAFKAATGTTPHGFVAARRMQRAVDLLTGTGASVPEVARAVGLANVSHFRRVFRTHTGHLPGDLRELRRNGPSPPPDPDGTVAG